jgi:hypothetical protein
LSNPQYAKLISNINNFENNEQKKAKVLENKKNDEKNRAIKLLKI